MPAQQFNQHPTDHQAQDAELFRTVLLEMIDLGADLVRRAHRQAVLQTEAPPEANQSPAGKTTRAPDAFVTFERITRTVRLTIALAKKLSEPAATPAAPRQSPGGQTVAGRRKEWDGDPAKLTDAELAERIAACRAERERDGTDHDHDHNRDNPNRPIAEIITGICRDLGIANIPDTRVAKRRIIADLEAIALRATTLKSPEASASSAPSTPPPPKHRGAFYDYHRPTGSKATDPP